MRGTNKSISTLRGRVGTGRRVIWRQAFGQVKNLFSRSDKPLSPTQAKAEARDCTTSPQPSPPLRGGEGGKTGASCRKAAQFNGRALPVRASRGESDSPGSRKLRALHICATSARRLLRSGFTRFEFRFAKRGSGSFLEGRERPHRSPRTPNTPGASDGAPSPLRSGGEGRGEEAHFQSAVFGGSENCPTFGGT
jgi:hypothetical protein